MKALAALWFRATLDECLGATFLVCPTLGQAQLPNHLFGAGPPSNPYNLSSLLKNLSSWVMRTTLHV
jgi:hypothetical protein